MPVRSAMMKNVMATDDPIKKKVHPEIERRFARVRELQAQGLDFIQASGLADLENRLEHWPPAWGNNLLVLIYGDFQPPKEDVAFPDLGIRMGAQKREGTIISDALIVLDAYVSVEDRSITSVLDAVRRINVFMGAWALTDWAHGYRGWWCYLMHGGIGGVMGEIDPAAIEVAVKGVLGLRADVRRRIDAALYWIRATRRLVRNSHHDAILQLYADYWNAFECLVEAVALAIPPPKPTRAAKQAQIDAFVSMHPHLTASDLTELYQQIVNPGFVGKAQYALRVCFKDEADRYIHECFARPERRERCTTFATPSTTGTWMPRIRASYSEFRLGTTDCGGLFGECSPVSFRFPRPWTSPGSVLLDEAPVRHALQPGRVGQGSAQNAVSAMDVVVMRTPDIGRSNAGCGPAIWTNAGVMPNRKGRGSRQDERARIAMVRTWERTQQL
jgi:hypothetical protein